MARKSLHGKRLHVIVTALHVSSLQELAKRTKVPVAEHVRRAIEGYLDNQPSPAMARK